MVQPPYKGLDLTTPLTLNYGTGKGRSEKQLERATLAACDRMQG